MFRGCLEQRPGGAPTGTVGGRVCGLLASTHLIVLSSEYHVSLRYPGSDDAVPPRFSSDVLGYGDPRISRGVTTRHAEGIYSRRLETSTYQMQEAEHRGELDAQSVLKCSAEWKWLI